jgi:hypothetical protein
MHVHIEPITDCAFVRRAAQMTTHGQPVTAGLRAWYRTEHSPIRARLFWIELFAIPSFVSVHLVRHKIGVEHYVESMRDDRGGAGDTETNRLTPVNHGMLVNAQALIAMSRKRLCYKSHKRTVAVWSRLRKEMLGIDADLHRYLVPECVYRNGVCPEFRECKPGIKKVLLAYSADQ